MEICLENPLTFVDAGTLQRTETKFSMCDGLEPRVRHVSAVSSGMINFSDLDPLEIKKFD